MRKIRTVFGTVAVKNPRWMVCQRCFPHFSIAFTVLGEICPDRATPELMEVTARLGSMLPYRKAAELMAEFLPIEPTEGHQTVRKRTLTLGARLEDQSLRRERETPPLACKRTQLELGMPDDPLREFVVSIDTAHIRSADQKTARDFEVVIARCGRGGRGMPPGHYFATSNTSQLEMRARTLQALQFEGYNGHGEVTVLSDGAEIMKRLPRALPKPTTHIIDCWCGRLPPASIVPDEIVVDLGQRRPSVERISRIGMDASKHFFQLHGVTAGEEPILRKKLRRKDMVTFFEKLAPTVIAIETCGGAHHWARQLSSFGHEVKLIAPQLYSTSLQSVIF